MKNLYLYSTAILIIFFGSCQNKKEVKTVYDISPKISEERPDSKKKIEVHKKLHSLPVIPEELFFAGERVPLENDLVRDRLINQLIIQSNRHSRTLIMLRLKSKWETLIKKVLKEKEVPEDFFYLAIAESELDNEISSHKKALGMWQILKRTGQEYGLIINKYIDQRRDPEKATEAACKYLKKAKKKLGSWTNAAASYNVGMSGLKSSMESQKETDYYRLFLNKETSKYVFRVLAMKLVYSNPELYGYHIEDKDKIKPFEYRLMELEKGRYNLIEIAKKNGLSFADLKSYNPWIMWGGNYDLVIKNKGVSLKLPIKE